MLICSVIGFIIGIPGRIASFIVVYKESQIYVLSFTGVNSSNTTTVARAMTAELMNAVFKYHKYGDICNTIKAIIEDAISIIILSIDLEVYDFEVEQFLRLKLCISGLTLSMQY